MSTQDGKVDLLLKRGAYHRMRMPADSLDVLEKASVAPVQARAIGRAIEIEIAGAKDTLATKQDVVDLHHADGCSGREASGGNDLLGQTAVMLGFSRIRISPPARHRFQTARISSSFAEIRS